MHIKITLILMITFAMFTVTSSKLRRAIVYMGIFSVISSLCYLFYGSPDVAIAEAVIGSGISTIIFLIAFKKYRVFTIYFTNDGTKKVDDNEINRYKEEFFEPIEKHLIRNELEPQIVYTNVKIDFIEKNQDYDLIIVNKDGKFRIIGSLDSYKVANLKDYFVQKGLFDNIVFEPSREEAANE